MTGSQFLELIVSLFIQSSSLIVITGLIVKRNSHPLNGCRLWALCHLLLLIQFLVAIFLPHLRLFTFHDYYPEKMEHLSEVIGTGFFYVWLAGFGLLILLLLINALRIMLNLKKMDEISTFSSFISPEWENLGEIRILACSGISSPFSWQIHTPTIVIPTKIFSFNENEKKLILQHETIHLHAGHSVQFFLQRLVEALYWFNPLVWWSSRQVIAHREFYCDYYSVQEESEVASYLKGILHLAEKDSQPASSLSTGLSFRNKPSVLQQRIEKLMNRNWSEPKQNETGFKKHSRFILLSFFILLAAWVPLNTNSTGRSLFSPWPSWSARTLQSLGISVRDYEIDGHRVHGHHHQ